MRLQSALGQATGREWTIDRPATFRPGPVPVIALEGLAVANPIWTTRDEFLHIDRVEMDSTWSSVLRGAPVVTAVRVDGLTLNLESDGDGWRNWATPDDGTPAPEVSRAEPATGTLTITGATVRFRSGWADTETAYPVDHVHIDATDPDRPAALRLTAPIAGLPFNVAGTVGSPRAMWAGRPFDVDLEGDYAGVDSDARVAVRGRVGSLDGLDALALTLELEAASLNDVGSISGFELPARHADPRDGAARESRSRPGARRLRAPDRASDHPSASRPLSVRIAAPRAGTVLANPIGNMIALTRIVRRRQRR